MSDDYDDEFGELGLVIGDFHIPMRTADLPDKFKELLVPNKVQYVFCTGNVGSRDTTDWIKTLSGHTHIAKGEFDESKDLPEIKVVTIGAWKIAIVHGHQVVPWGDDEALYGYLRELDADVLISGHTHVQKVRQIGKKYLINPGSATGAYSSISKDVVPSFIILEFKEHSLVAFLYSLVDGEVKIDKNVLPLQK